MFIIWWRIGNIFRYNPFDENRLSFHHEMYPEQKHHSHKAYIRTCLGSIMWRTAASLIVRLASPGYIMSIVLIRNHPRRSGSRCNEMRRKGRHGHCYFIVVIVGIGVPLKRECVHRGRSHCWCCWCSSSSSSRRTWTGTCWCNGNGNMITIFIGIPIIIATRTHCCCCRYCCCWMRFVTGLLRLRSLSNHGHDTVWLIATLHRCNVQNGGISHIIRATCMLRSSIYRYILTGGCRRWRQERQRSPDALKYSYQVPRYYVIICGTW